MPIQTSLVKNSIAVLRRIWAFSYTGEDPSGIAPLPVCFGNGDAVYGLNTASSPTSGQIGTPPSGLISMIGINASDQVNAPNGLVIPSGQALTIAAGASFVNNAPGATQYVSVPYTLAQLLATNSAPRVVIPAQGAGTLIEVVSMTLDLIRGSAAFAGGGAVAAYLGTDATGVIASAAIAATVFTTFPASQIITVAGALAVNASANVLNKGIAIANPTADFTSGTGATGVLQIAYRVHSGLS